MIITKRADELKPGDIIVKKVGRREVVAKAYPLGNDTVGVYSIELDNSPLPYPPIPWANHKTFDVEVLDLTSAQKHADKLVELLRDCVDWYVRHGRADGSIPNSEVVNAARDLLDEIDPPEPPNFGEVLDALVNLEESSRMSQAGEQDKHSVQVERNIARDIIERARKAGMIK